MIEEPIQMKQKQPGKQPHEIDEFQYNTDEYEDDHEDIQRNEEQINLRSVRYSRYRSIWMLVRIVLCYNLSSFYVGYALVYFNSIPYSKTHELYNIQLDRGVGEGLFSGMIEFGAVFGAFSMRYILKYFSRRQSYFLANTIAFFSGIMIIISDMRLLFIGRFLQGVCVGLFSTLTPLVIKEIIPVQVSGMLGSLYMTSIILGSLIAYIIPTIAGQFYQVSQFYQFSFGFPLITIAIQAILLFFVYKNETPKYLLLKGKIEEAKKLIKMIYKQEFWDIILEEKLSVFRKVFNPDKHNKSKTTSQHKKHLEQKVIEQNQMQMAPKKQQQKGSSGQQLNLKKTMKSNEENQVNENDEYDIKYMKQIPVARGFAFELEIFQQFTGIYVIALYGREIVMNYSPQLQPALPIMLNTLRLIASLIGIFLISKFGRKKLMLVGTLVICLSLIGFCIGFTEQAPDENNSEYTFTFLKFLVILSFIIFTSSYSCTLGPITYLYIPEIVQPPTIPFTSMISWLCAYLMIFLFPIIREREQGYYTYGGRDGIGLFVFFTVCTVIHLVLIWRLMIQTKFRSEQEIRSQYKNLAPFPCLKKNEDHIPSAGSQNNQKPQ